VSSDARQRTLVEALTPLGTSAFTLFSDGTEAVFLDHLHRKFWRGQPSSIGTIARGLVPIVDLTELALLLVGLPVDDPRTATRCESCETAPDRTVMQQGDVRYVVAPSGLAATIIQRAGETLRVDYSPPAFPPSAVSIGRYLGDSTSPAELLEIRILDLGTDLAPVVAPAVPSDYGCCAGP
jgi:hypothetical protein